MRGLSASELMDVWERGWGRGLAEQALVLLAAAMPQSPRSQLAALSVGQRDALLLQFRASTFGSWITTLAACPDCRELSELNFSVLDLLVGHSSEPGTGDCSAPWLSVEQDGWTVLFRLPNTEDLLALAGAKDPRAARLLLLERCVSEAARQGAAMSPNQLPPAVLRLVADRMEQADPQADVRLVLDCPSCGSRWQAAFDIVSFLWQEIDGWARRTIYDVYLLATAYGWCEADILAMSPWRRQHYLELAAR